MKKVLIPLAKLGFAGLLIFWLIHTKKITAEPFIQLWATPWLVFFIFAVIFLVIIINNYRWLLLLQGQRINSSQKQTLPLTFIGLFFNLAMPGSVGGDVIKAYYIAQEQPGTKLRAATSVLMDRVVGLYAMAIIALFSIFTHADKIMGSLQLRPLGLFIFCLVAGFTLFFLVGFSETVRSHLWTDRVLRSLPGGKILARIYDTIYAFREGKRQFVLGILLSIVVQTAIIFSFYIIAQTLHYENVTMGALCFVIPLGLIATAVPVSPGGVGVGQAVFLALFGWYGGGIAPAVGPTLITIYQVVQAIWSLVGAGLYFSRKNSGVINLGNTAKAQT